MTKFYQPDERYRKANVSYTINEVDSLTWDFDTAITGKPTTLAGYGITDGLTEYAPPGVRDEATDPYTLVIGDANKVLRFTTASASITIPVESSVNFPVGTELWIRQAGTGADTITTTGLTINGTIPALAQNSEVHLRKVGADEWDVA